MMASGEKIRLNKFLASCGAGSRRSVETLVEAGAVSVDGKVVRFPGTLISPGQTVCLRGEPLLPRKHLYVVFYKPEGYVCSLSDPHNATIYEILPESFLTQDRIFPIGRLDKNSQGLLLLTNDGDFSHSLGHPSQGISKTYEVMLRHPLVRKSLLSWREGVPLEGKKRIPLSLEILSREPEGCWIRIVLQEGLKREIRLMAQHLGNSVLFLKRIALGNLKLNNLLPGTYRTFSKKELWCMIHHGGSV
jgi:23S rRNA pseudouridine2605 synthase